MTSPLVSVVLPCHDAEAYLRPAVESILGQTHRELELVALDDGSRDRTAAILGEAAVSDPRVRVLTNPTNLGLIRTLNRGVEEARGRFVARMDADDVAAPRRLERQLAVFRAHPDTDLVGAGVHRMDEHGRLLGRRPPRALTPDGCRFLSCLGTPLVHPSVLARRTVMAAHPYREAPEALHTEDYELFARLVRAGAVLRNVAEPLLRLRRRPGSVSRRHEELQIANFCRCAREHLRLGWDRDVPVGVHAVLVNRLGPGTTPEELRQGLTVLDELAADFRRTTDSREADREVRAVAAEQRVDILLQAMLKGGASLRWAGLTQAMRRWPTFVSGPGRRYLLGKRFR